MTVLARTSSNLPEAQILKCEVSKNILETKTDNKIRNVKIDIAGRCRE
jgi:hypothetical protein